MTMIIGTAKIDITPPIGCDLSGFLGRTQPSTGMHSPLFLYGLYLYDGQTRLLWLHADLIGFEQSYVTRVKAIIQRQLGLQLKPEQIILSVTHTHSGPATMHLTGCGNYNAAYMKKFQDDLLNVARLACEHTEPVTLQTAVGQCELATDRRKTAHPHHDPRVGVWAWTRSDGSYAAILTNYGMHNVALKPDNRLISSDIAGQLARNLTDELPGRPVTLCTNGTCGNIDPPPFDGQNQYADVVRWGRELTDAVKNALTLATHTADSNLHVHRSLFRGPLEAWSADRIRDYAKKLSQGIDPTGNETAARYLQAIETWKKTLLQKNRLDRLPTSFTMDIHAVRLGGHWLIGLSAEPFSQMIDRLNTDSERRVFIAGYANGCIGYLAPLQAYAEGGYETESSFIYFRSLRPQPENFDSVCDTILHLIHSNHP